VSQRPTLHVTIVTAQQTVFDGEAEMVIAPGSEGQLGILPHHAPLLTTLALGELRLRNHNVDEGIFVAGGFLEVNQGVVTILADDAERAADIDEGHAEEARRRAQALKEQATNQDDAAVAAAALEIAVGRLRVAESHRQRGGHRRQSLPTQELGE
jgi:F-type H+-transporting ATPase subunit epsilon